MGIECLVLCIEDRLCAEEGDGKCVKICRSIEGKLGEEQVGEVLYIKQERKSDGSGGSCNVGLLVGMAGGGGAS